MFSYACTGNLVAEVSVPSVEKVVSDADEAAKKGDGVGKDGDEVEKKEEEVEKERDDAGADAVNDEALENMV